MSRSETALQDALHPEVDFTLSCRSEARALRTAGFLRRRRACRVTTVHHVAGARRDTWHVHGSTHPAVQSLESLECVWTWLRKAAQSHPVDGWVLIQQYCQYYTSPE